MEEEREERIRRKAVEEARLQEVNVSNLVPLPSVSRFFSAIWDGCCSLFFHLLPSSLSFPVFLSLSLSFFLFRFFFPPPFQWPALPAHQAL